MNQEDKNTLYKDITSRLPYNVRIDYNGEIYEIVGISHGRLILCKPFMSHTLEDCPLVEEVKPCLFPLESMSEEDLNNFYETIRPVIEDALDEYKKDKRDYENERPITLKDIKTDIVAIEWMLERHYDIYGLIEKGLAKNASKMNIY